MCNVSWKAFLLLFDFQNVPKCQMNIGGKTINMNFSCFYRENTEKCDFTSFSKLIVFIKSLLKSTSVQISRRQNVQLTLNFHNSVAKTTRKTENMRFYGWLYFSHINQNVPWSMSTSAQNKVFTSKVSLRKCCKDKLWNKFNINYATNLKWLESGLHFVLCC